MNSLPSSEIPDPEVDDDHPEPENPWTPEVLARYGPETEAPF